MAGESSKFNEAMARAWTIEVEGELDQVNSLLQEVADECATQPYEDDTIMNALHATGEALGDAWREMGNQFKSVISETLNIISKIAQFVSENADKAAAFTSNKQA